MSRNLLSLLVLLEETTLLAHLPTHQSACSFSGPSTTRGEAFHGGFAERLDARGHTGLHRSIECTGSERELSSSQLNSCSFRLRHLQVQVMVVRDNMVSDREDLKAHTLGQHLSGASATDV